MSELKKLALPVLGEVDRRTAVKAGATTLGLAAWAAAIKPWFEWTSDLNTADFLQKHYRELTPAEMQAILNRLTDEARKETGQRVVIKDQKPIPGVVFGYALNLSICIGCRKCVEACHHENNHDRPTTSELHSRVRNAKGRHRLRERQRATTITPCRRPDKYYMPVQCQQCENPPVRHRLPDRSDLARSRTASSWSITTGASAAAIARPRVPITLAVSTGPSPKFRRTKSTRIRAICRIASGRRA